jgi:hypothetical protein
MKIVWPSTAFFDAIKSKRREVWEEKHSNEATSTAKNWPSRENRNEGVEGHVWLSSKSFSTLDPACISRMALFNQVSNAMPYKSASLHFKSACRLLALSNNGRSDSKEYISWFLLTSACLSKAAQGQPTPYRDPASDEMSYCNFELGVLFCSRLKGDKELDRLYVSDPNHKIGCQCGKGDKEGRRSYKIREKNFRDNSFLDCVTKVHLPVPYLLRPEMYQDDPDSYYMSHTPAMHIMRETACVGNNLLHPLGQQLALEAEAKGSKRANVLRGEKNSKGS